MMTIKCSCWCCLLVDDEFMLTYKEWAELFILNETEWWIICWIDNCWNQLNWLLHLLFITELNGKLMNEIHIIQISVVLDYLFSLLCMNNTWYWRSTYKHCTIMPYFILLQNKQTLQRLQKLNEHLQQHKARYEYSLNVFLYQ